MNSDCLWSLFSQCGRYILYIEHLSKQFWGICVGTIALCKCSYHQIVEKYQAVGQYSWEYCVYRIYRSELYQSYRSQTRRLLRY